MNDELQQALDNLHATQHQLRISAERGVALQAELDELRAGTPRRLAMTNSPSSFGEPWFYDSELESVYAVDEDRIFANIEDDEFAERIVACVNALAGRDPAKLAALLDACDGFVEDDGYPHPHEGSDEPCYLDHVPARVLIRRALAELRGAAS